MKSNLTIELYFRSQHTDLTILPITVGRFGSLHSAHCPFFILEITILSREYLPMPKYDGQPIFAAAWQDPGVRRIRVIAGKAGVLDPRSISCVNNHDMVMVMQLRSSPFPSQPFFLGFRFLCWIRDNLTRPLLWPCHGPTRYYERISDISTKSSSSRPRMFSNRLFPWLRSIMSP